MVTEIKVYLRGHFLDSCIIVVGDRCKNNQHNYCFILLFPLCVTLKAYN